MTGIGRRAFVVSATTITTAALSGCLGQDGGGTSTDGSSPTGTATDTETATPEGDARQEYPDYNWEVLDGTEPEATTGITARNTAFDPVVAEVPTGEPVTFANNDSFEHTVTIPALDVDERLDGGEETTLTFEQEGTFDYVCTLHPPSMLGRLVVTDDAQASTPTEGSGGTPTQTADDGGYY